jgi:hypothetical protein
MMPVHALRMRGPTASVDATALAIYNKLTAAWGMHETSSGVGPVARLVSKAHAANNLNDSGGGFVASTTGLRGSGQQAAKFGDGSGSTLQGPSGAGANDVVSVITGQAFCWFGVFWAETLGDTIRAIVAKTFDFSAGNTEYSIFSFSGGLRFSVRGPVTREIDAPNPPTGTFNAVRAWVDDADMFPRIQVTPLSSGLAGTKYSHTLACVPTANSEMFSFARGGGFFPLGDASNEGRLQDWFYMRGNGNFLTDAEWLWMLNSGQWRTFDEIRALAGIP